MFEKSEPSVIVKYSEWDRLEKIEAEHRLCLVENERLKIENEKLQIENIKLLRLSELRISGLSALEKEFYKALRGAYSIQKRLLDYFGGEEKFAELDPIYAQLQSVIFALKYKSEQMKREVQSGREVVL